MQSVYTHKNESVNSIDLPVNPAYTSKTVNSAPQCANTVQFAADVVWLTVNQSVNLLGISKVGFHKRRKSGMYTTRTVTARGGTQYKVLLSSLDAGAQARYWAGQVSDPESDPPAAQLTTDSEADAAIYAAAPDWARRQADKYLAILQVTQHLKGRTLKEFIAEWNATQPEGLHTSYPRVMAARRSYRTQGVAGLLADYGKSAGNTVVSDEWFAHFRTLYLKEGGPPLRNAWLQTLGQARIAQPSLTLQSFPSCEAFRRRLMRDVPASAICLAREGRDIWNRKYGPHLDRDVVNVPAGHAWFSDHRQLDILLTLPNGKHARPWVTVWRDFKTSRWLGWSLHIEDPNSDHIFEAFHHAASRYGIPKQIYIDNGKDYRSKDLTGGRRTVRVQHAEHGARSLMALLNIAVTFARPYGAQSKTLERDFRDAAAWFDKNAPGYVGRNPAERPQAVKAEVASGRLLAWGPQFVAAYDSFIEDVLNAAPVAGKALQGRSRSQAWQEEFAGLERVSDDALKLCCSRVSGERTIGRNGIIESRKENLYYWAEWMVAQAGKRVYVRRDSRRYQVAWVFNAKDDEYLGKAELSAWRTAALAETDLDRAHLQKVLSQKRAVQRSIAAHAATGPQPSIAEKVRHMAAGNAALAEARGFVPADENTTGNITRITAMDDAINEETRKQRSGTYDISAIVPAEPKKKTEVILWPTK